MGTCSRMPTGKRPGVWTRLFSADGALPRQQAAERARYTMGLDAVPFIDNEAARMRLSALQGKEDKACFFRANCVLLSSL